MEIAVSKEHEAWLIEQVGNGIFPSVEFAIDQMIAERILLEGDDLMWAKPLVDEALAAIERGEVVSLEQHQKEIAAHMESLRLRFPD